MASRRRSDGVRGLTITDVVKAIRWPVKEWSGNCYAVACAILRAKLVEGRPAYGHWTGPIAKASPLYREGAPFARHGWIVLPDGETVLDPTRWVFEAVEPYLFVGTQPDDDVITCENCGLLECEHWQTIGSRAPEDSCDEFQLTLVPEWPYDEGGDRVRAATQRQMPIRLPEEATLYIHVPSKIKKRLGLPIKPTLAQIYWLANLPYSTLRRDAWAVCLAIEAAGYKGYIPIDTWNRANAERGL